MCPNVLKSLHIYEYYAGLSGSEQKTSALSESTNKNTNAEKQSGKENWVRFPRQLWSSVGTDSTQPIKHCSMWLSIEENRIGNRRSNAHHIPFLMCL